MSTIDEAELTPEFRERVHAAAREELTQWGIDRFSIMALADRNGLPVHDILQFWSDEAALIIDVLLDGAGRQAMAPDTGSLRDDGIEIRRTLWRVRAQRLSVVFSRAHERGELRAGVDPAIALEMLLAPINMRALFTGEPIDEPYCRRVADLVWQAIRS